MHFVFICFVSASVYLSTYLALRLSFFLRNQITATDSENHCAHLS